MILNLNKIRTLFYIISYRCKQYVATRFVGKIGYENLVCRQQIILSEPGLKLYDYEIVAFISYKKLLSHERGSERSERASERVSAAEGASDAREQANN